METIKQQIEALRKKIDDWNYRYYVLNQPTVGDYEFDQTLKELEKLEAEHPKYHDPHSPTQRVGSDINRNFAQVEHLHPMLSLTNTYSEAEITEFYNRTKKALNEDFEIVCELKYDGASISLIYKNGLLMQAITRGDGARGDDVTVNVRTIRSIPLRLQGDNYPPLFEIRGEILLPWQAFYQLNDERAETDESPFANPRNAASGSLKTLNIQVVAQRKLDSYLYYLLGNNLPCDGHYENMEAARNWGFKISDAMRKCKTLDEVFEFIRYWNVERKNLPVAIDGIVLKVNSAKQQLNLGWTAKSPRWAIAYKFQAESVETQLLSVDFQVGRLGTITPVANLNPILLSGTVVRRASLHNAGVLKDLDLYIGDWCRVEKGGEVIPKITGVNKEARFMIGDKIRFVKKCPACGTYLVREPDEMAYYCPNHSRCEPQIKGMIEHFVSRRAMNINAGEETVETFYKAGLIRNVADLYDIQSQDICRLERWGENRATNYMDSLQQSKQVPYERVLYALGIRFVGEAAAKRLANTFPDIDTLMQAGFFRLISTEEIGERTANSLIEYFAREENRKLIERLRAHGLQFALDESILAERTNLLKGKTFVISGVFTRHSRDEYKNMIEKNGGRNSGTVSSKTDFILAGENMGPAKLEKAQKWDIKIIDEEDFLAMI
ncbi:MAG: NAD-dependent DNA ligase LigA [Dysgonamonadaceae bacterium]|jgi:DNA ligase (NAD+)|nr:NAD-dependent DNA ligase LigA [Dysgonamonadaceae bacterium]